MPAVGPRALFSATRAHVTAAPRAAITSSSFSSPRRHNIRAFHASSTSRSKPTDDPSSPETAGEQPVKPTVDNGSTEKTGEDAQSAPDKAAQSAFPAREVARGASRARAWRGKSLEEMPRVNIPPYWAQEHIWTYDRIKALLASATFKLSRLPPDQLTAAVDKLWPSVVDALASLKPTENLEELPAEAIYEHGQILLEQLQQVRAVARWYLLAVSRHTDVGSGVLFWLSTVSRDAWAGHTEIESSKWFKNFRPGHVVNPEELFANVAANLKESEYSAMVELVCRARNELAALPPKTKALTEVHRPVTVLAVLNYKGPTVANEVIYALAYELEADVLQFDASSIADIIGNYLGQTPYWSRGAVSSLGYAAAEMNGRIPSVGGRSYDAEGSMTFEISSLRRLGSSVSKKDLLLMSNSDERWEDLKITQALETLIKSLDTERSLSGGGPEPERPVIIHVRDYIELGSLAEGILQRLRAVVDRLWRKGKRIILIGSTSSNIFTVEQWRTQLAEVGKEDCHVIPYHTEIPAHIIRSMEEGDNALENIRNLTNMLLALEGNSALTRCTLSFETLLTESKLAFGHGVLNLQAIYRLASLLLGSSPKSIGPKELEAAAHFLQWRDTRYVSRYPYTKPLYPRKPFGTGGPNSNDSGDEASGDSVPAYKHLEDSYERDMASGLINAKDLRITFDDIVAPGEMIDSIKALTSLSIIRPEAFSYGILKVERIPGLLMYGPPGTGKTLLAKAIAKESGASMLEISAATINSMYVGEAEKNVQALFRVARKLAPMIVFLDEGDALLGTRHEGSGHPTRRIVLTQFLREMDGLTEGNKQVFVIVATNRPFDLDEAILRRLPRKVLVDLPLRAEREAILGILLRDETLEASTVSLAALAAETDLYSGSDLKNLCVAAAMAAVKEEMRAHAAAGSPKEGYAWPEKRVLARRHFDAALREIGPSISEDMESLGAIRKFDDKFGDASGRKRRQRRKTSMGFEVVPKKSGSEETRVRAPLLE